MTGMKTEDGRTDGQHDQYKRTAFQAGYDDI